MSPKADDSELHELIGRVIRSWQQVESVLDDTLATLLWTDQIRARMITASMSSFKQRRELLLRLAANYMEKADYATFFRLVERAKKFAQKRNWLAHCMVVGDSPQSVVVVMDTFDDRSRKWASGSTAMSYGSLRDLDRHIRRLTIDIHNFQCQMRIQKDTHLHRELGETVR
jgi:hypothetical protein